MMILIPGAADFVTLPDYVFGGISRSDWGSSLLQTGVVLVVWIVVHRLTSRVLARLHYLERMLRMCAWCRKINDGEEWVPMEQFFSTKFDTRTSHGMCPACAEAMEAELRPGA